MEHLNQKPNYIDVLRHTVQQDRTPAETIAVYEDDYSRLEEFIKTSFPLELGEGEFIVDVVIRLLARLRTIQVLQASSEAIFGDYNRA